nr:hypothetical protein [Tanacetum cinerariifolium]
TKKDKTAIAFLYQALPEEQLLQITKHKTAKAVWDALEIRHVGVNCVQQAKQQTLKSEFEMLQMKENESIDSVVAVWDALEIRHVGVNRVQQAKQQTLKSEFVMLQMKENESIDSFVTRLTDIINKASSVGLAYEDSTLVRKLLNVAPDRFLQIVASIEQYSDLDEMSLDEAIERLKTFKERLKNTETAENAETAESAEITENAETSRE